MQNHHNKHPELGIEARKTAGYYFAEAGGTLLAVFLYARGAPNVWSDYAFVWACLGVFVAACVLGSLALATLKLLFIAIRKHDEKEPPRRSIIVSVGTRTVTRRITVALTLACVFG